MPDLGIRREDKNEWERRAPLTPSHVEELVRRQGLSVAVQPSARRVYADDDYRAAGAELAEDLSDCRVILGVKEVPARLLLPRQAYLAFFHVIKGQPQNMPILRRALDLGCTMMDYEKIVDRRGKRLIFFGRHAGYAGMIDGLWALGRRMAAEGTDSPFAAVEPAHRYGSLAEALALLETQVGRRIREQGVPPELHPLVFGFTGGGNVSQGAQEVLDRLPVVTVRPEELPALAADRSLSHRAVYKVVFRRGDRADFARHLPHLTVLVNGIYWEPGHPRLLTLDDAAGSGAARRHRGCASSPTSPATSTARSRSTSRSPTRATRSTSTSPRPARCAPASRAAGRWCWRSTTCRPSCRATPASTSATRSTRSWPDSPPATSRPPGSTSPSPRRCSAP